MRKTILSVLNVWLLICANLIGLIIITPETGMTVSAKTIIVDDNGIPGVDCNYTTIQEGIDNAIPGDTVFVKIGTYYENVIVNKTVNLTGEDRDSTIIDGGGNNDVVVISADWVNVTGFIITEGKGSFNKGVKVEDVHNCRIYNNTLINNDYGIYLYSSTNNTLSNNTSTLNNFHGIYLYSSSNCSIALNNVSSNNIEGIYLSHSSNNTIANNNVSSNGENGILCSYSSDITAINNTVSDNFMYGIYLSESSNITILNNTVTDNKIGISLWDSTNNIITNNTAYSNIYEGIRLYSSDNNIMANNIVSWHNYSGIILTSSNGNTVTNNTISNSNTGVYLSHTRSNTITNNTMVENSIYITGTQIGQWTTHIIDTYNTVNGKPVYYLKNQNSGRIPSGAGQIILANCKNIIAENQIVNNGTVGIEIGFSDSNLIANNTASSNNLYGIYLYYSNNNIITNNTASSNNYDGIHPFYSDSNTITNNTASSNNRNGIYLGNSDSSTIANNTASSNNINGIRLGSANSNTIANNTASSNNIDGIQLGSANRNTIANNILSDNEKGIYFDFSSKSIIKNNRISNNSFGINLSYSSSYNIFHHNYFLNNLNQIFFDTSDCDGNSWDDGFGEGNYWDDYMGVDDGSNGRTAGDEVGDTLIPHPFTDQGFGYYQLDNYPLMHTKPPRIQLIFPDNNSIIPNGTVLDFSIIDVTLIEANYSVNGGANTSFTYPFDIYTGGWADRDYHIQVNAVDFLGYANSSWYFFIIDSIPPFFDNATEDFITYTGDTFTIYANLTDGRNVTSVTIHYKNETGSWTSMLMDKVIEGGPGSLDHFSITSTDLGIFTLNDKSEWYFYYEATDGLHNSTHGNLISYFTITVIDNIPPIPEAGPDQIVDEDTLISIDAGDSTDNLEYLGMYYTWDWDASDGIQVENTTISATHIYPDPGIYTVTLNVTDSSGNWGIDTLTVIVKDVTSPNAVIGPNQTVDEDTLVTADAGASTDNNGTSGLNYAWDWDASDGIQVENNTISATHVYPDPGIYIVTLNITDASGNWDVDTLTVIVMDVISIADAGSNQIVDEDTLVTVDAGASTGNNGTSGLTYIWDWDASDGITADNNTITASHIYSEPGVYTVTLNVTDSSGNWDVATITITVVDITSPIADAGSNASAVEGQEVIFNGTGSDDNNGKDGLSYTWSFVSDDELVTLIGISPSYTFELPGTYIVTLYVFDDAGNWNVDTVTIIVLPDFDEDGVPDVEDDDDDNDGYLDENDAFPQDPEKWKKEEPSFMIWIFMLVLVVIIICIFVLLFVMKKRGQKPEEEVYGAQPPSPEYPQPMQQPVQPPVALQSFPVPPVPPVPPPSVQRPPPLPPEITTYNCPYCGNPFSVQAPGQAVVVNCPSCSGQVTIEP